MAAMQEQSTRNAVGGAFAPSAPPSAFSGVIYAKAPPCCVDVLFVFSIQAEARPHHRITVTGRTPGAAVT
jgi:hypothetical protein